MRYRLTKKGKIVFTVLSFFLLITICALAFGVRSVFQFLEKNPNTQSDSPPENSGVTMEQRSSPPPDVSEAAVVTTEPPVSGVTVPSDAVTETQGPDVSEEPADTPLPASASPEPSGPSTNLPIPSTIPPNPSPNSPSLLPPPPSPSTIPVTEAPSPSAPPPPSKDVYETTYLIEFPENENTLDEKELASQLKSVLAPDGKNYTAPKMQSHYLVIQGYADAEEPDGIALQRSRFVRKVLRGIGLPDNKMLDMSADDTDVESLNSVLLYFIQIDDK